MPFSNPADRYQNSPYCVYCTNSDGSLKTYSQVLSDTVNHLVKHQGIDAAVAHEIANSTLKDLPAWKENKI